MTKRGSTNLPQKSKPEQPAPAPTTGRLQARRFQEYKSKAEREAIIQRYVVLGVLIALVVGAVLLAGAFIVDDVITPGQTVAIVNGQTLTVRDFQTRVRLERALINEQLNQGIALFAGFGLSQDEVIQQLQQTPPYSTYLSEIQVSDTLGNRILNQMIDDVLVQQEAERLGITVSAEEVQVQINDYFGYDPEAGLAESTATPEPSATPTPFVSPTPSPVPTECHALPSWRTTTRPASVGHSRSPPAWSSDPGPNVASA